MRSAEISGAMRLQIAISVKYNLEITVSDPRGSTAKLKGESQ